MGLKVGDKVVLEVAEIDPVDRVIHMRLKEPETGRSWWISEDAATALRPLPPTLTPEDAAVLDAADAYAMARDDRVISPGILYDLWTKLRRAANARRAARHSAPPASAPQPAAAEPWTPKVGDRVRIIEKNVRYSGLIGIIKENDGKDQLPWLVEFTPNEFGWFNSGNMVLEPSSAPAPTPITDLERAVVDAAVAVYRARDDSGRELRNAMEARDKAIRALIAAEAPADPVAELREAAADGARALELLAPLHGQTGHTATQECGERAAVRLRAALAAVEKK